MNSPGIRRINLSWREQPAGGSVSTHPAMTEADAGTLAQAQHLVLLIHGYNNDMADAAAAYRGFHARQNDLDGGSRYGLGRTFVEVYWPGDAAWGFASFLFYMGSIRHAIETAERLAAYIAAHIQPATRIDIVAHSMGCRLSAELLRALGNMPAAPQITRVVFMAAAVPTFMLEQRTPPRRLRPGFDRALREHARSLYSGADHVLAFAFPAGQSLARGAEGFMPAALGHERWSDGDVPHNLGQAENPGAGHSDYWGWNERPLPLQCALRAAREIHDTLQFPSAGDRIPESRYPVQASVTEARFPAAIRTIVERDSAPSTN